MMITNIFHLPAGVSFEVLGLVFGHAVVEERNGGRWLKGSDGKNRPWSGVPEDFRILFEEARSSLVTHAEKLSANAVIAVQYTLSRAPGDLPEMSLVGTAVRFPALKGAGGSGKEGVAGGQGIAVSLDGKGTMWTTPAATPAEDVLRMMREREMTSPAEEEPIDIQAMIEALGISREKADLLKGAGLDTIEKLAEASLKEISAVEGINPTQARIIKERAVELLGSG